MLQEDIQQAALKAFHSSTNSSAGIATYVLHEHLHGVNNNLSLESDQKNDLKLHEVSGIDPIQPLSPCTRMIERTLGLPFEKSAMLFTVASRYDLDLPEVHNEILDYMFVGVQLATVWPGVRQDERARFRLVKAEWRGVASRSSKNTITFYPQVPPLLSLVSLMRIIDVRENLYVVSELPFGADLRRTALLRALVLVGP